MGILSARGAPDTPWLCKPEARWLPTGRFHPCWPGLAPRPIIASAQTRGLAHADPP